MIDPELPTTSGTAAARIDSSSLPEIITSSRRDAAFFIALMFVTALPLVGLGFALPLSHPTNTQFPLLITQLFPIIAATGIGHVASTCYLYTDRGFWKLMSDNLPRFFVWPMLAVAFFVSAYSISPVAGVTANVVFFAWQLHHYQRQNYGIIAFAAQSRKVGPLPKRLRLVLDFGTAGGVLGGLSNIGVSSALSGQESVFLLCLRYGGRGFFVASAGLLIYLVLTHRRVLLEPRVLVFSLLGAAFFLPTLMSRDILVSIQAFAIGHGAQYLLFLIIISRGGLSMGWSLPDDFSHVCSMEASFCSKRVTAWCRHLYRSGGRALYGGRQDLAHARTGPTSADQRSFLISVCFELLA